LADRLRQQIANLSLGNRWIGSIPILSAIYNERTITMMKPNKTFKLSKSTKRMMCSIVNTEQRNQYKRMMIQAELAAGVIVKREAKPTK
jgi:hypothetical protein